MHSVAKAATARFTLALLIAILAARADAQGGVLCDSINADLQIAKSDCDHVANYLEGLGQSGEVCSSKIDYHDENGCTIMNTYGTMAYNGCANGTTLPAASYPVPDSSGILITATYKSARSLCATG
ncbi:hypothetical protein ABBQ32_007852 [Trebouxia sp. C0010 RCD-2024]